MQRISVLETQALFCHSPVCIKTYDVTADYVFMMIWHKPFISLYQQNIQFEKFKEQLNSYLIRNVF